MNADFNYHGDVVVFDLDDTLIRERDFCRSGFRWIRRKLIEEFGSDMIGVAMRMESHLRRRESHFDLLERILSHYETDPSVVKRRMTELVAGYRSHRPDHLPWANGAQATLEELSRRGTVMAIVTDGRSITQHVKIEALGLDRYIPYANIYISEERGADKSSPDSFRAIVRSYPEARRFIYVGDNPEKDFAIPNLLGWHTFRVAWHPDNVHPYGTPGSEIDAPSAEIATLTELLTL